MPTYAINKKARFDYEILETLEAGLVLTGPEVKSVRAKQLKLTGGFITIHDNEAILSNVSIPLYKYSTIKDYEPDRTRKILLSRKEITYLTAKSQEKGLTIVPLSVYTKGRYIKLAIGIAKGKKTRDKRQVIKDREQKREANRAIKEFNN
ncbi:SsrA-binding protein SmpB [Candidatus Parcubacteria bacterium]|jgi:SsrA-binding protein|nr:SsrA-binding protein SmpB [Candidatus Parcubacteria bacterium]MBT3948756.1 SsrA-binding protein SmpB [Candidatus Parcubacteria bacterium]